MTRTFTFIGVSTASSSIMRVFPRWREALGLGDDVELVGWDLALDAPPGEHRSAVERIREDDSNLGALVTTHKLEVIRAAADLFDEVDEDARLLEEVSCISKRNGRLIGSAKDARTAAGALEAAIAANHFGAKREALILGAGGAGTAIALYLAARRADRPARVQITDTRSDRLEQARRVLAAAAPGAPVESVANETTGTHEALVTELPEGSLIVNATGLGKDRPGSPLRDGTLFPRRAVAWELNYRGELDFLRQAERQAAARKLEVLDGWEYFIRGWAAVIEDVFHREITDADLALLSREAEAVRSALRDPEEG
jgi:shikimate dehydrogenase